METNNLQQFGEMPTAFLTEITEEALIKELNKEQPAPADQPAPDEKKADFLDIEAPASESAPGETFEPFGQKVGLNNFLSDELGTELYDAIVTTIAITALNFAGIKSTKAEMQFTAKEKSTLRPIVKECIDSLNIKFTNCWEALGWTTLLLIGTKIVSNKGEELADLIKGKPGLKKAIVKEKQKADDKKTVSKYMLKKYGPDGKPKTETK